MIVVPVEGATGRRLEIGVEMREAHLSDLGSPA